LRNLLRNKIDNPLGLLAKIINCQNLTFAQNFIDSAQKMTENRLASGYNSNSNTNFFSRRSLKNQRPSNHQIWTESGGWFHDEARI